jgi:hypothetical protein
MTLTAKRLNLNAMMLVIAIAMIAAIAHIVAAAPESDGRINVAPHLGGDVVYCVDGSKNVTSEPNGAGIRLLNQNGSELFYVPAGVIAKVAEFPAQNTLIAEGNGSYGKISLYRLSSGQFQLNGTDEHGKAYSVIWNDCTPVNPIPDPNDPVQKDLSLSNDGGNDTIFNV